MAGRFTGLCHKLQKALLHNFNKVILLEQEQFYSKDQNRIITMFVVSERVWDETKGKYIKQQLFKTASQIDLAKYLGALHKELSDAGKEE